VIANRDGTPLSERFGLALRRLRLAQGWSQERLAEAADLNRSYVGEVERGLAVPSLLTAEKLSTALGLSLSMLLAQCESVAERAAERRNRLAS
jgi:XRE family transcriptional regulator, regulator of sulfur utilization